MRRRRFNHTSALILFILLVGGGLLFGSAYASQPTEAALPTLTIDLSPYVESVSPVDGLTEVFLASNVNVTFSAAMDETTIDEDSFYLTYQGWKTVGLTRMEWTYTVDAVVTVAADGKSATLNPAEDLDPGITYTAHLTDDIKGGVFNFKLRNTPYTWSFTTVTRPEITARAPAADATNVPLNQVVSVTFDKAITGLGPASFYLTETVAGTMLIGGVAYDSSTHTATLTPAVALKPNTSYTVTITSLVKGSNDLSLENAPITWKFTTGVGKPVVTSTTPADGATDVPVDQVVSATFSTSMNASTLTTGNFFIKKSGGSALAAAVAYNAATQTATLDPSATLEADVTYIVTLSANIKGATGDSLDDAPVVWDFTTAAAEPIGFTDVIPGVTPYATAIAELAAREAIIGFDDDTFRPNDLVTRQQFAKMIVKSLNLAVTGTEINPFTDVAAQVGADPLYPSKYVAVCFAEGITTGKTTTTFAPYDPITHQQLISMITRAAGVSDPPASYAATFTAAQFYPNEHYLNAKKAAYAGLLNGLLGVGPAYDFFAGSTRGECAQLLYNLIILVES